MEYSYPVDHGDDLVADLLSQFNNGMPGGNPQVPDGQPQPTQAPREAQPETQPETFQCTQLDTARNIQSSSGHAQRGGAEGAQSESLQPEQPEGQLQCALQLSATYEQAHQPEDRLVAVKVPRVENREEYEYLPRSFRSAAYYQRAMGQRRRRYVYSQAAEWRAPNRKVQVMALVCVWIR